MITQLLFNHTSPETAYLVEDYPYGFRLRCKIRYWLEFKKNKGFRLVSQTTNPKQIGEVWNKPKHSTYCRFGAAMYLNEQNHVTWAGLTEYSDLKEMREWIRTYGAAVPEIGKAELKKFLTLKEIYEKQKQAGNVSYSFGDGEKKIVAPEFPEEKDIPVKELIEKTFIFATMNGAING